MAYILSCEIIQTPTGDKYTFAGPSNFFPLKLSSERFLRLKVSAFNHDVVRFGSLAWQHTPTILIPLYCHEQRLVCIFSHLWFN
jgi:hypothetical protein